MTDIGGTQRRSRGSHEALSDRGPVPSAATIAALARALRLPAETLLKQLRKVADASSSGTVNGPDRRGPGLPIALWDPHGLEVHPGAEALYQQAADAGLTYVLRELVDLRSVRGDLEAELRAGNAARRPSREQLAVRTAIGPRWHEAAGAS